jgi:hypothetical protein
MNPETLKKTLTALHQELSRAPALDEQSRQLLREIMRDVEGLGPSPPAAPAEVRRHRLEELAIGFEIEHPTLAAGLRQLTDLLAKAGL